jgi:exosortase
MQRLAAHSAVVGLNAVGIPALREGNMIHLAQGSLEVAEACSGIRSLYAFLAVGALAAAFTPIPLWGRIAVLLTTIPVAIAGNAIRVWISGVGTHTGRLWAVHGTMHEVFGLLTFLLMLGLFLLFRKVARLLWSPGTFSRSASSAPLGRTPD